MPLSASERQSVWVLTWCEGKIGEAPGKRKVYSSQTKALLANHTCKITCKKAVFAVLEVLRQCPTVSKLLEVWNHRSVSR